MFDIEQKKIEKFIQNYCSQHQIPLITPLQWSPIPFSGEWGISTSFFQTAAKEARSGKKVNVPQRAQEIAESVAASLGTPEGFTRIEATRGYLNLFFSGGEYTRRVVNTVLSQGDKFGHGMAKNQQVMVEYSQPNTHKAFHVGHLRSAILGDVIARILEAAGYDVIRANYPGDIGLHVIKWLWNYKKFHSGENPPKKDVTHWMGEIYSEAIQRLEENPELENEIREIYALWDQRDPEIVDLWEKTRQWSLDGFNEIYSILDIPFDIYYFNSQAEIPGKEIVAELIKKGIAIDERPNGPVIVRLDDLLGNKKEKYRVFVVLRSDNTALYSTEDLALAKLKFSDYPDLAKSIYIVDVRQSLHFQQVFKTLELAGYSWAKKCIHLPYELVNLPGNVTMSSREGTVVLLEDLIREAIQRASDVVKEKNPELPKSMREEVARSVALGAIKYPLLARDNAKIATFDWEAALDFNGQAAPYIQYMHVRANSILRKLKEPIPNSAPFTHKLHPAEIQLIDFVSRVPGEIQRAAYEQKTLHVTNLSYNLARAFSDFYSQCQVLKADKDVRDSRLRLVAATKQTLANLLNLLGIPAPDVM